MLQQELERLRTDIDKMRNESKFVTSLSCPYNRPYHGKLVLNVSFDGLTVLEYRECYSLSH